LRAVEHDPEILAMRRDRRRNVLAAARIAGWSAGWDTSSTHPTRRKTAEHMNVCGRTVTRHWRYLEGRGFLICTEPGTPVSRHPAGALARTWTLALPGNVTPSLSCSRRSAPTRPCARDDDQTHEDRLPAGSFPASRPAQLPAAWPLGLTPQRRPQRQAAAAALQRECWPLRRIPVAALASLLRGVFDADRPWIPADVLYALDHFPSGRPHLHGEAIRYPRAWLAYRLALWDGHPPHSAELAERAEAARAARARAPGRQPGSAPPPEWHRAREAMRSRRVIR
jgi:hypothetical protein